MKPGKAIGAQREYENELIGRDAAWPAELLGIEMDALLRMATELGLKVAGY